MNEPTSNSAANPYAPPVAHVDDAMQGGGAGTLIPGGRSVPAGNGAAWLSGGWEMFKQSPGTWIGMILVFIVIYFVVALIPLINLFNALLMPLFVGGVMIASDRQRQTGSLQLGDLFAGFQNRAGQLVLLGVIAFGVFLLMAVIAFVFVGFGALAALFSGGDPTAALLSAGIGGIIAAFLIMFVVSMLVYAALWYAPALVVLNEQNAIDAMKMSFTGCMRNMGAGFVYFIISFVLMIFASLPIMLGWLVLAPVMWASVFVSYRDIFIED